MLQRCVATNRCCPKLPEEEFCDPNSTQAAAKLYCNPYMLEELAGPGMLPTNGEFPPSALSLMYSPPMDTDQGHISEDDGPEDIDEWMTPFVDGLEGSASQTPHVMRPVTPRTQPASPGLALLASTPREEMYAHEDTDEFSGLPASASIGNRDYTGLSTPSTASSANPQWREGKEGTRRSPSAPPSAPRSLNTAAIRSARSATPSSTTPRRCAGDAGDVQPSLGPMYYPAGPQQDYWLAAQAAENPWLAAQMNFRGRRMFGDETNSNPDAGAATIATIRKCIEKAQGLPEQQRPNSEKWTERWSSMQVESKDVL
mmetsp:Transcript_141178/g.245821  ORF Transcript_141178/g.245821 Transcript_141178/m.245821 type:complete len:314 (+) Transcript_141178:160-1101(+)